MCTELTLHETIDQLVQEKFDLAKTIQDQERRLESYVLISEYLVKTLGEASKIEDSLYNDLDTLYHEKTKLEEENRGLRYTNKNTQAENHDLRENLENQGELTRLVYANLDVLPVVKDSATALALTDLLQGFAIENGLELKNIQQ